MPERFRRALLLWYGRHGRDLPWRRTKDPYAILISEVMLQQTQVATVMPYYQRWLQRFPNFRRLARASETDVLHAWEGLGYYARARNLHLSARTVMREHGGRFPQSVAQMRQLPGLGRYTANAVATFAFDQPVPVVEANIARLLSRILNLQLPIDSAPGREELWRFAATLVPKRNAARLNSALMDLGALVCLSRQPKCEICPVRSFCAGKNTPLLPRKRPRAVVRVLTERHAFTRRRGRVLLEQAQNRWRGLWTLPILPNESQSGPPLYRSVFPFTNHRITLEVWPASSARRAKTLRWFSLRSLASTPLPSPHRRALEHLLGSPLPPNLRHHALDDWVRPRRSGPRRGQVLRRAELG